MSVRYPTRRWRALTLLPLCVALSACFTTRNALLAPQDPCPRMLLATHLLDPTPGTPVSTIDGTAGGNDAFGLGEAGARVSANIDKARAREFMTACPAEWAEAMKRAQKAVRPRFLGVF